MTIPTRDVALAMLDSIPSDYQQVDELKARLRSFIESHTGEPVAWVAPGTMRTIKDMQRYGGIDARDIRAFHRKTGIMTEPLYASPVQPVLECPPVRSLIEGAEIRPVDILQEVHQMFTDAREEGRSEMSSKLGAHFEARVLASWEKYRDEYLSIGDK